MLAGGQVDGGLRDSRRSGVVGRGGTWRGVAVSPVPGERRRPSVLQVATTWGDIPWGLGSTSSASRVSRLSPTPTPPPESRDTVAWGTLVHPPHLQQGAVLHILLAGGQGGVAPQPWPAGEMYSEGTLPSPSGPQH